jgi:hypothetical protein
VLSAEVDAAAELTAALESSGAVSTPAASAVVCAAIGEVSAASVEAMEVPTAATGELATADVSSVAGSKSFHDQVTGIVPLSALCRVSLSTYHSYEFDSQQTARRQVSTDRNRSMAYLLY